MGERTQCLITVTNEKGQLVTSQVRYWQWGLGRVMLMDMLHFCTKLPSDFDLKEYGEDGYPFINHTWDKTNSLYKKVTKTFNHADPVKAYQWYCYLNDKLDGSGTFNANNWDNIGNKEIADLCQKYLAANQEKQTLILQRLKAILMEDTENWYKYQDNNDGFMRIDLKKDSKQGYYKINWHFYNRNFKEIGFKAYCKMSDNNEWTTTKFQTGFQTLLDCYEIKYKK